MQQRLIDANALLEKVAHRNALDVIPGADFERIWVYSTVQLDMFKIVKAAPTIDAVQVVHGKWQKGMWATYPDGYVCDKCNTGFAIPYSYCPACGAKMDGGVKDG